MSTSRSHWLPGILAATLLACGAGAQSTDWGDLKQRGAARSSYREGARRAAADAPAGPDLQTFRERVRPILSKSCFRCHGERRQKGDLRIDALDPDLFAGDDVDWWLDVLAAVSNGEMPPEGEQPLDDADQARVVEWLSSESQRASKARRASSEHTSFRRMSGYEFSHALQDLLGVDYDFTKDLPPDPASEDGFTNSSEVLQISTIGFRAYLNAARKGLQLATVSGPRPAPLQWSVSMADAAAREWRQQDAQRDKLRKKHADQPEELAAELQKLEKRQRAGRGQVRYVERGTGRSARTRWGYNGGKFAWPPREELAAAPPADAGRRAVEREAANARNCSTFLAVSDFPAPDSPEITMDCTRARTSKATRRVFGEHTGLRVAHCLTRKVRCTPRAPAIRGPRARCTRPLMCHTHAAVPSQSSPPCAWS